MRTNHKFKQGQKFGEWTIVSDETLFINKKRYVTAVCSCGKYDNVHASNLTRGRSKSCGCLRKLSVSLYKTRHGMTNTTEYQIWCSMKKRCENKNNHAYMRYGGRGITVCDRWQAFENFYEDMGPRPSGATIDRIDNSKGYSKDNCRWADYKSQSNNRRNVKVFNVNGVSGTMPELCEVFGIRHHTVWARLKAGVDAVTAFTKPVDRRKSHGNSSSPA